MPEIMPEKTYDLAISFLTPHYFVTQKVRAKKKIAWIHTDYSRVQVNVDSETQMWDAYDHIASISEAVTERFLQTFPGLSEKIILIENILPEKLIRRQADVFSVEDEMLEKGIRLLSIGRYCAQKNFDNIPDICARLVRAGLDVYWYIIGFGSDENLIKEKIRQFGVEDRVIMLGKKDNPYPYIDACDVYVQPSRYEGKSVTVREAQMLGKPVIITNYSTAKSQLEDGVDGIIVPLDLEGCTAGIAEILGDKDRMNQLADNCRCRDYSNAPETQKIYQLV
jgi:glycosyltransferase involved in cell wall biosynthesis